jgi:hypothetical protein
MSRSSDEPTRAWKDRILVSVGPRALARFELGGGPPLPGCGPAAMAALQPFFRATATGEDGWMANGSWMAATPTSPARPPPAPISW